MVETYSRHQVRFHPGLTGEMRFVRHSDYAGLEESFVRRIEVNDKEFTALSAELKTTKANLKVTGEQMVKERLVGYELAEENARLSEKLAEANKALDEISGIGFDAPRTFAGDEAAWSHRRANIMQQIARRARNE